MDAVARYKNLVDKIQELDQSRARIEGAIEADTEAMKNLVEEIKAKGYANVKELRSRLAELEAEIETRMAEAEKTVDDALHG